MKRILVSVYVLSAALYLYLAVIFPTDPATIAKRHLSMTDARIITLSVAIPLIVIWFFALYGSLSLQKYSQSIRNSRDGPALYKMATGVSLLALYLPLRSVLKSLLNYVAHTNPSLTTATNLVITYVCLLLPLVAYVYMAQAAHDLRGLTNAKRGLKPLYIQAIVFSIVGATFCYATFGANSLSPSDWLVFTDYDIALPLRIITIIIPYLFMWFIGLRAAYDIFVYQREVKGVFYRRSLRLLALGIILEILASVLIQYITAISASFQHLPTAATLAIVYGVLIMTATAFVIIALGVRRLKRLEEA